jgi:hypothetical protein
LRRVATQLGGEAADRDQACFRLRRNDSSRSVAEKRAECTYALDIAGAAARHDVGPVDARTALVPRTSDEALRLAIKLAEDAGECERATAVLEVLTRSALRASVTSITKSVRRRD